MFLNTVRKWQVLFQDTGGLVKYTYWVHASLSLAFPPGEFELRHIADLSHNPTCYCFHRGEKGDHQMRIFPPKVVRPQHQMWVPVLQVGHCFGVTSPFSLIHLPHTPKCLRSTEAFVFRERDSNGKCVFGNTTQLCPPSQVSVPLRKTLVSSSVPHCSLKWKRQSHL